MAKQSLGKDIEFFLKNPVKKIRLFTRRIRKMYPRAVKYGFWKYFFSKKFRKKVRTHEKNQEQTAKYTRRYLNNKKRIKENILRVSGAKCNWCQHKFKEKDLTIDHIKRAADGGTSSYSNLQLLCRACHYKKDVLRLQKFQISWENRPFADAIKEAYEKNRGIIAETTGEK